MTAINQSILEEATASLNGGNPAQCRDILQNALKCFADASPPDSAQITPIEARIIAAAFDALGRACFVLRDPAAGVAAIRQGAAFLNMYLDKASLDAAAKLPLQTTLIGLWQNEAFASLEQHDYAAGKTACSKALELASETLPEDSPKLASVYFSISALPYRKREWDQAEELTRKAMHIWQNQPTPNLEKVATCMNNLGRICEERGETEAGIAWHRKAVDARRKLPNLEDLAFSLGNLGVALAQKGQWTEARAMLEEAVQTYENAGLGNSRECRGYVANLEICRKALSKKQEDI